MLLKRELPRDPAVARGRHADERELTTCRTDARSPERPSHSRGPSLWGRSIDAALSWAIEGFAAYGAAFHPAIPWPLPAHCNRPNPAEDPSRGLRAEGGSQMHTPSRASGGTQRDPDA